MNLNKWHFLTSVEEEQSALSEEKKEVLASLEETDLLNMTPLTALQYVFELKEKLRSAKG